MGISLEHLGPLLVHELIFEFLLFDGLDFFISGCDFVLAFLVLHTFVFFFAHVLLILLKKLFKLLLLLFNSLIGFYGGNICPADLGLHVSLVWRVGVGNALLAALGVSTRCEMGVALLGLGDGLCEDVADVLVGLDSIGHARHLGLTKTLGISHLLLLEEELLLLLLEHSFL